jgi:hypothetical protein
MIAMQPVVQRFNLGGSKNNENALIEDSRQD